jgi:MoaA/NifB/PqqE/SkfB family radical SAM enzyme/glycosyltransferase involved in cell wall biosynthesis
MSTSIALIDLFLRTGFRKESSELCEWISSMFDCKVTRYAMTDDFAPVAQQILHGTAPFVVLMDDCGAATDDAVLRLLDLLTAAPECSGATLGSRALTAIYGDFPQPGAADPSIVELKALPPWFSIVRRSALRAPKHGLTWKTPEFLLLDQAMQAVPRGLYVRIGDEHTMELDGRSWAVRLLDSIASRWSSDFRQFCKLYPDAESMVPPQFAVDVVGQFTEPPKLARGFHRADAFPKISVICPIFKPDYLAEMLDSIQSQTWVNWELNLIVDGPPEPALNRIVDTLQHYADDPRIRIAFQANRGTGPTRDALASASTGDFILSVDDDDALTEDALETFASAILHNPGVPFFRGGAQLTGLYTRRLRPRARLVIAGIANDVFEVTQPFVIARAALQAIGGFEWDDGLRNAGEDTILFHKLDWLRLETRIIDRVLYYRRLSTKNLTLEFNREECANHAVTLNRMAHPPEWKVLDCHEELEDDFQHSSSAYQGPDRRIVFTSTRFFQYRTFGPVSDTTIDLELTSVCNAVCTFCPREVMPDKTLFLPVSIVERLTDQINLMKRKPEVVFCGIGESTLHPELVKIAGMVAYTGSPVSMTTNGARMTPELFHRLVSAGMYGFNFSLNAATPETYQKVMKLKGLDKVSETIDQLIHIRNAHYPWVGLHVSFVVCEQNRHEVHHFVEQWRNRRVTQIWLHPVNNRAGLMAEFARPVDLEQLELDYADDQTVVVDVLRKRVDGDGLCKVARSFNFISAEGDVRLCAMDYRRKTRYGNLGKDDLQSAHYNKLHAFLAGSTREICDGCDFDPHTGHAAKSRNAALVQIASTPGSNMLVGTAS